MTISAISHAGKAVNVFHASLAALPIWTLQSVLTPAAATAAAAADLAGRAVPDPVAVFDHARMIARGASGSATQAAGFVKS